MANSFSRAWGWAKDHPYYIVGGVVFLIILFWIMGRGSSSSSSSSPMVLGADPNILAYNAALQASNNQLQLGLAQTDASTAQAEINAEALGHYVDVSGAVAGQQATLQADTLTHYFDTVLAAQKDTNATAVTINEQNVNEEMGKAWLASQADWLHGINDFQKAVLASNIENSKLQIITANPGLAFAIPLQ